WRHARKAAVITSGLGHILLGTCEEDRERTGRGTRMTKKKRARVVADKGDAVSLLEYLDEPDQQRYEHLSGPSGLTKAGLQEKMDLRAKSRKRQDILRVWQYGNAIRSALEACLARPKDPSAARDLLRALVTPCYPNFEAEALIQCLSGAYTPQPYSTPARQGLESVLYAMDHARMVEVLDDPEQRLYFLTNLSMMLEPFRMLRREPDLKLRMGKHDKLFEFISSGTGSSIKDQTDATLEDWGVPCFDVHLLHMAGIKITPAIARVSKTDRISRGVSAYRASYLKWSRHPVRVKCLKQGDPYAREVLAGSPLRALIDIAFPPLSDLPRTHRFPK
ncbi:MAG: hypothetical protein ABIU05_26935, partial [Nitrospirales bacterium]